jgi:hypothetical protein
MGQDLSRLFHPFHPDPQPLHHSCVLRSLPPAPTLNEYNESCAHRLRNPGKKVAAHIRPKSVDFVTSTAKSRVSVDSFV